MWENLWESPWIFYVVWGLFSQIRWEMNFVHFLFVSVCFWWCYSLKCENLQKRYRLFTDPILNSFWIFHVAIREVNERKLFLANLDFFERFLTSLEMLQFASWNLNLFVLKFQDFFEHFHNFPIYALFFINKHEKSLSNWQIHNWKAVWDETCKHGIRFFTSICWFTVCRRKCWWEISKHSSMNSFVRN